MLSNGLWKLWHKAALSKTLDLHLHQEVNPSSYKNKEDIFKTNFTEALHNTANELVYVVTEWFDVTHQNVTIIQ